MIESISEPGTLFSATDIVETKPEDNHDFPRSSRSLVLDREFVNIESYQLVWLSINEPTIPSIQGLRRIVDYTKLFSTIDECLEYIDRTKNTITFIVCSREFAPILTSKLQNHKSVSKIYVFDFVNDIPDAKKTYSLSDSKVKETVYTNQTELLKDLSHDVQQHVQFEEQNCDLAELKQTSTIYFSSSWISLVDFWCHLQYPDCSRQRLIEELTTYYAGQDAQLKVLEDFNKNYTAKNAIQWYTKDAFIYRSLNSALRQQNIKLLFLYGFFIQDLYQQLDKENENFRQTHTESSKLTVYRGQRISRREIESINKDMGAYELLVNKSFFSTTLNRNCALIYLNDQARSNDDMQNVLFEIEIDLHVETKAYQPFASISHLSQFPIEDEILFMIGTAFKVNTQEINYKSDENVWIMKLTLEGSFKDYETNLKVTDDRRALKNCINLLPKTTLNDMNDISIDQLEIIFQELFLMYPSDIQWISAIQYRTLAIYHHIHSNDYNLALVYYDESVKRWLNYIDDEELNCLRNIAKIYSDMAICYDFYLKDLLMANKHYDSAIHFYHLALERHPATIYEKIKIYKQLGYVYDRQMDINNDHTNYDCGLKSIKYYELYVQSVRDIDATEDYSVFNVLREIARLYIILHDFDKAVSIYEKLVLLYQQLTAVTRQNETAYDIESVYRRLITLYTYYQPNYELAIHCQLMLYESIVRSSFRTSVSDKDHVRYAKDDDDQYKIDRKKELLAIHYKRLAKINQAFNKNDLARTELQHALNLYNEIPEFSWVYLHIPIVQEKILLLDMILKTDT